MLQRTVAQIPSTLSEKAVHDISGALMLAGSRTCFALYLQIQECSIAYVARISRGLH